MCSHDTCDYSVLGLPSDSALKTHLSLCHENLPRTLVFPNIKTRTLEQALEDAIAANNPLAIAALATELASFPERKKGFVLQALTLGYREAALTLLDLLGTPSELDHIHKSTAILMVCEIGNEELFDILAGKGANINLNTDFYRGSDENPFTIASQNRHLSIARKLLDNKDYDRSSSHARLHRKGALAMASRHGHAEAVALLLEKDSNHFVKKTTIDFNRALAAAIKGEKVACARLLLNWAFEKDTTMLPSKVRNFSQENIDHMIGILLPGTAIVVEEDGGTKGNILQVMAYKGDCEAVSSLLDLGADIDNCKGEHGTPMMAAASNGKLDMIHLLIERRADINKKQDNGRARSGGSAIDIAAAHGHEAVVRALLDRGAVFTHESVHRTRWGKHTALQALGCKAGSPSLVRLLLESGADVDAVSYFSKNPESPLQLASKYGHNAISRVLLEYGANVNHRGFAKYTPLYLATKRKNHSMAAISTLLAVKSVDVNAKSEDSDGHTALHLAAKLGKSDVSKILLDHRADINAINSKGETALVVEAMYCPYKTYPQVLRILVKEGADIEMVDGSGNTMLMIAAGRYRSPQAVFVFRIERGAETSTRNFDGQTALMIAAQFGNASLVECLLQHRTSQYTEINGELWSAVKAASWNRHVSTVRALLEFSSKNVVRDHPYLISAALSFVYSNGSPSSDMISLLEEYGATGVPLTHEANANSEVENQNARDPEGYQNVQNIFSTDQDFQADGNLQIDADLNDDNFQANATSQPYGDSDLWQPPGLSPVPARDSILAKENIQAHNNFQAQDNF